jgi:hypothetical protein
MYFIFGMIEPLEPVGDFAAPIIIVADAYLSFFDALCDVLQSEDK